MVSTAERDDVTMVLKVVLTALVGAMLGLLLTLYTLDPLHRGLEVGPWRGSPRDGTLDIDPYALATIARAGLLPLGAAEGLSFEATQDGAGKSLSSACDYEIRGPMPAARFWTLGVLTPDGVPMANPAQRYAFTSADVLWQNQEPMVIAVSPDARPGNWLPVGRAGAFVLTFRLYDTGLSAAATRFGADAMPSVRAIHCG